MPKKVLRVITLFVIVTSFNSLQAQSFGFGCLGLAGFYAGVSEYRYDTPGINEYANSYASLIVLNTSSQWKDVKFEKGTGYRIGTNFFRAKWNHFFLSAKGYYQFVKEEHTNSIATLSGQTDYNFQLTMNNWGVGVDLGIPILGILDWKILEGNVNLFSSNFTFSQYQDSKYVTDNTFSPDKLRMGYFLGTGLILHLVPDYISVEGTAGFNFLQIDKFSGNSNSQIPIQPSTSNVVDKGGWSATLQLNVGFPL